MHILICSERFLFRYGMDRVFLVLADGFRRHGHRVTLLANRFDPEVAQLIGARTVQLSSPAGSDIEGFTREWLEGAWTEHFEGENHPDIILHGGWPFFSSIPFLRTRCENVVYSDHGMVPLEGQPEGLLPILRLIALLRRRYLANCSAVVGVSDFIRQSQSRPDSNVDTRCEVIYNGVDHLSLELWRASLLRSTSSRGAARSAVAIVEALRHEGRQIVLSLGRWEPGTYKGSDDVYEFARTLRTYGKPFAIILFAPPEAVAVPADCAAEVYPIGYPDDTEYVKLMQLADTGVSFSRWEGFNLPLAEMQWCERPAFVLDLAAHPEVVSHRHFLAQDVRELATKTADWLAAPGVAVPDFAALCREFRRSFTWDHAIEQYLKLFSELVAESATAPKASRPSAAWWTQRMIVDVSNSVRDPANTGVIRVTRRLSRTLQQYCEPIFVAWQREQHRWVLPTLAEFEMLGRFNGPRLAHPQYASPDGRRIGLEDFLATQAPAGGWILLPETIHEQDAEIFRNKIRSLGLYSANIFYDSIPLIHPEFCNEEVLVNHGRYMRGLARLDVVLPISEFSAECLRAYWEKERVGGARIVANPLSAEFGGASRVTAPLPVSESCVEILCVSTLEPRKNHERLLAACQGLDEAMPDKKWRLTLVGNRYAGRPDLAGNIERLCSQDSRFRWLGVVDDQTLASLYRSATFTVYPSLIEGYGMPIMESVWFGRPCICHEEGVMAELAKGGGCLTTNVTDPSAIRAAIVALATDAGLHRRLSLEAIGRPIKTWRDYGEEFLRALETEYIRGQAREWERQLFPDCLCDGWQMSESERAGMYTILGRMRPTCAIEIGTFKGGSLSLISQLAETVFSIDIDPTIPERFSQFENVSFLTGPSRVIMPNLLAELDAAGIPVEFVLVDGDHSEAGVKDDLNSVLAYRPKKPLFVVMHDSYNPVCRRGILTANWAQSPYLQWLDIDFVPGRIVENGSAFDGQIWGGLALAYLTPQPRFGPLLLNSTSSRMQALMVRAVQDSDA